MEEKVSHAMVGKEFSYVGAMMDEIGRERGRFSYVGQLFVFPDSLSLCFPVCWLLCWDDDAVRKKRGTLVSGQD